MTGETDLDTLLRSMEPTLHAEAYGFGQVPQGSCLPEGSGPFALIAEDEGVTVIATVCALRAAAISHDGDWARISLTIHSSLSAVGLTAAVAKALADRGISANVVAGLMHDHFFVQWDRRHDAMAALATLGGRS